MTTGWPEDVLPTLKRQVRRIANTSDVGEFYIGRTANPRVRKSQHDADKLISIYSTTSVIQGELNSL